ncbi:MULTISPECIES: hypothetical protein [unclassified Bradyrhizobium]
MSLLFHRAVEHMEIWSASSDGYSFVISFESLTGPGFRGSPGYVASWRPFEQSRGAIRVVGSPFKTFAEAEAACTTMLSYLASEN